MPLRAASAFSILASARSAFITHLTGDAMWNRFFFICQTCGIPLASPRMSIVQDLKRNHFFAGSSNSCHRFYVPRDLSIAQVVFGANCGPAALAACLSRDIKDIMRLLPHFEDENRRYTNLTAMKAALSAASVSFEVKRIVFPSTGLALIQWTGPWTDKHFFSRWSLCHTHWVAVDGDMIYDIFNGIWQTKEDWARCVVPIYLKDLPQAAGWQIKYGLEVSRCSSELQDSFLNTLFLRPSCILR